MRWLLHGQLFASVAEALSRHEQVATVAEADLTADEVFEAARKQQLEVMTADAALPESLFTSETSNFKRLIVHLNVDPGEVEQDDAVDRLFARYKRLTPGRLYTVTATRVKVRQLPTTRYRSKP
jgi:predicted nuclease of predicted toxin-antitoxin system